jgi:lysophospholipase L1-like esterase
MEPVQDPTVACAQDKSWFPKRDWLARHEALIIESRKKAADCKVVFLGDSITEGWQGEGKEVWEEEYGHYGALNLGIGGDEVQHVLWRVQNGEVDGLAPECAVILIGTNNIGNVGHAAGAIAPGIKILVGELRKRLPDTRLLLMGTFPRDAEPDTAFRQEVIALNKMTHQLRDGDKVFYLDIGEYLTDYEQRIHADTMPDFLHLSAKGYQIWADKMALTLRRLVHGREGRQTELIRAVTAGGTPGTTKFNIARPSKL